MDRVAGLDDVRADIAMMRTPDGHSKLELTRYQTPAAARAGPENPPPNTLGLHRVMFAVDDIQKLTRARDPLAARRRRMPWMAVEKEYRFDGPEGR